MKSKTLISNSPEETIQFASRLGARLPAGSVVVLHGNLGSGKTVFVKGVAKGVGGKEMVTSPTFVFVNVYQGRIPVYHLDLYRIESPDQADSVGYEEYFDSDGVTLIEWGERVKSFLPKKAVWIEFEVLGEKKRRIRVHGAGQ
jgi:tRNA threonylcarbamoyladenosine biosynthesis protein TsaE